VSGEALWPPSPEAVLPLLGLSDGAAIVADAGVYLRAGRDATDAEALVARTAWLIADHERGVVVRSTDRVLQVAAVAAGGRFTPFARVHWADLPRETQAVAAVVAPLCRSAERLHALRTPTP
jgi:hypothetical protein